VPGRGQGTFGDHELVHGELGLVEVAHETGGHPDGHHLGFGLSHQLGQQENHRWKGEDEEQEQWAVGGEGQGQEATQASAAVSTTMVLPS
jgi:hypothetical protein